MSQGKEDVLTYIEMKDSRSMNGENEIINIFGRELLAGSIVSVDLKKPSYERKLMWTRLQATLGAIFGLAILYIIYTYGSDWYLWLLAVGGIMNIPYAIGAWATPHVPKWQVSVQFSHNGEIQSIESEETAYWTMYEATSEAHKIFDAIKASGMGDAHRIAFKNKYQSIG